MNKRDILSTLDEGWQALLNTVAGVPLGSMERPNAVGSWSVKDLVGHISTWEEEALKGLNAVAKGEARALYGDIDPWNARAAAAKAAVPLTMMLVQMGETHQRFVSKVAALPARVLGDPEAQRRLRVDGWEHYAEHRQDLERFLSAAGKERGA